MDRGAKISRNARLLVNKPKPLPGGQVEYTITRPLSDAVEDEEEYMAGADLDTEYIQMVEAHAAASEYQLEFRVHFSESGSFFVQLAYADELDPKVTRFTQATYINVEPVMALNGKRVRCKELSLMTVMSRCLGKMDRWPGVLQNALELGYNAIHFTPISKYGHSFSHYSIADQTTVDDYYFDSPDLLSKAQRLAMLKEQLGAIRE